MVKTLPAAWRTLLPGRTERQRCLVMKNCWPAVKPATPASGGSNLRYGNGFPEFALLMVELIKSAGRKYTILIEGSQVKILENNIFDNSQSTYLSSGRHESCVTEPEGEAGDAPLVTGSGNRIDALPQAGGLHFMNVGDTLRSPISVVPSPRKSFHGGSSPVYDHPADVSEADGEIRV